MWNTGKVAGAAGPPSGWRVIFQFGLELHLKSKCLGICGCLFVSGDLQVQLALVFWICEETSRKAMMKGPGANPYTLVPCSSGLAIDILIGFRAPPACPDVLPNKLSSLDASSLGCSHWGSYNNTQQAAEPQVSIKGGLRESRWPRNGATLCW